MRAFRKLCIIIVGVFILLAAVMNIALIKLNDAQRGIYRVEAKRLADDIEETGSYDLSDYPHLTGVFSESAGNIYQSEEHYVIIDVKGTL